MKTETYSLNLYFCKWDTFYSKLIRKVTKAEFSHVGIGFMDSKNSNYIYEALYKGFSGSAYSDLTTNEFVKIIPLKVNLTRDEKEEIENKIKKYIGRPYDWKNILVIWLSMYLPIDFMLKFESPRKLICSEAVALTYKDIFNKDLSREFKKDEGYISPQELYDYFTK